MGLVGNITKSSSKKYSCPANDHKLPTINLHFPLFICKWLLIVDFLNTNVLLHVKRERVRVTSDSGAPIRYTSRSRTLLGFTTRRVDTSKWHNSPFNTFTNKSERRLPNDILAQGRGDYRLQLAVIFSPVFAFISDWVLHVMTLRELTGYTCDV